MNAWTTRRDPRSRLRPTTALVAAAAALSVMLAACSDAGGSGAAPGATAAVSATPTGAEPGSDGATSGGAGAEPSPSISTLTPIALPPPPPPTGEIRADMRQSSIDAALGRMQVWLYNDLDHPIRPVRLVYTDDRFTAPIRGQRLREMPSQAERGFVLPLPAAPDCDTRGRATSLEVVFRDRGGLHRRSLVVADETDVVGRYLAVRCTEIAVARVAQVRWSDRIPYDGQLGHDGALLLQVRPTGGAGTLRIESIVGSPMLTAVGASAWRPRLTIAGDDAPQVLRLPLRPARCDDHIFMEGGGNTAFRVHLRVDGREGQLLLRLSPTGARHAIAFVRQTCGL